MLSSAHRFLFRSPLWQVGFRPFFMLGLLAGVIFPPLWLWIYFGHGPAFSAALLERAPLPLMSPAQWHGHEMFFGFGAAVLGGFLLTSTKNWMQIRGYHGPILMVLALAWLQERLVLVLAEPIPAAFFWCSQLAFTVLLVALLLHTFIRYRAQDSFADNPFFVWSLPLLPLAKVLMLIPDYFPLGTDVALGVFRLAFLLMLERTLTQFMRGVFQLNLLRDVRLDTGIKGLAWVLIFSSWLPPVLTALLESMLAALLVWRFAYWHPRRAFQRLDIGIMYAGYLGLVAQLLLHASSQVLTVSWVGNLSVHTFSFAVMGLIIPAMIIRISQGHTGRRIEFTSTDRAALWLMLAACFTRLIGPQLTVNVLPAGYKLWLMLSASAWSLAFALLAWRLMPFLFQARIDGREH